MEAFINEILNETIRQDNRVNEKIEEFPEEIQQEVRILLESVFLKGIACIIKAKIERNN